MLFLLPVLAALCVGLIFAGNYILSLPAKAEELYGPPSPQLSALARFQLSYQLVRDYDMLTAPTDPNAPEAIFTIDEGESAQSVLDRLGVAGFVADTQALRRFLIYTGLDTRLQSGSFRISAAMSPIEIAQAMMDTTPQFVTFNILPGWRAEEIAAALPTSGLDITIEEFLAAIYVRSGGYSFLAEVPLGISLEGYLMPGSYEVARDISAEDLVSMFLANFEQQVTADLRAAFAHQGLTLHEAVTLASIVEREAIVPEEQPLIASAFLNRLAIGMKLDADPTVQYALGFNGTLQTWWTNPLSGADLQIVSPYNTYLNTGLPPGPIANPGLSALQAVAFPPETPYYFFRAACDGSGTHVFAVTLEEHAANACE